MSLIRLYWKRQPLLAPPPPRLIAFRSDLGSEGDISRGLGLESQFQIVA